MSQNCPGCSLRAHAHTYFTQLPHPPGFSFMTVPSRPVHLKITLTTSPGPQTYRLKGLRKYLQENTQGLWACPKRIESFTQSWPRSPEPNRSACSFQLPTSTRPLSFDVEPDPTLKEFSSAKFKIMSLLSLVVLVASNTWEERPQGK